MHKTRACLHRLSSVFVIVGVSLSVAGAAQSYPQQNPIRLLVGSTPGGAADTAARAITRDYEKWKRTLAGREAAAQ